MVLAAAGLALAPGCAVPGLRQIQSDLDGIQQQLWKLQKSDAALADQMQSLKGPDAQQQAAAGGAELKLRLDAIERDLATLKSHDEDADQRLEAIIESLRAARETLQVLTRSLPISTGPPSNAGAGGDGTGATAAAAPGAAAAGAPGAASGPAADGPGGGPRAVAPGTAPSPDDLYRRALGDFTSGNDALALQEAQDFVRLYPSHALADDAQYLIGRVYETERHYPEAIAAYDQLLQAYPNGDKAPGAYLEKGFALLETNRTAEAVIQLQHVITAYPRSEEARAARERLRDLGLKDR